MLTLAFDSPNFFNDLATTCAVLVLAAVVLVVLLVHSAFTKKSDMFWWCYGLAAAMAIGFFAWTGVGLGWRFGLILVLMFAVPPLVRMARTRGSR